MDLALKALAVLVIGCKSAASGAEMRMIVRSEEYVGQSIIL
jgi:hypothetical protein